MRPTTPRGFFISVFFCFKTIKEIKIPSLKNTRNILLLSHDLGYINDDELLLLYEANQSDNLVFNHKDYEKFRLGAVDEDACKALFRVLKPDFPLLLNALQVPDVFECELGTIYDGLD